MTEQERYYKRMNRELDLEKERRANRDVFWLAFFVAIAVLFTIGVLLGS